MAVFFGQAFGALANLFAKASSIHRLFREEGQGLGRAKLGVDAQLRLCEHAHFVQLHHRTHGGPEADGVDALFVAQQVGVLQGFQVVHAVGGAQSPSSFVLQAAGRAPILRFVLHREVGFVHLADAPTRDGATKAGLVGDQVFFAVALARRGHGFGRNVFGTFKLHIAVVARGQGTYFVDDVHENLRAIGRQALACDRVVGQDFFLLGRDLHEGLGVAHIAHAQGATHGQGFEVFAAHHSAHARAACGTVQVVHHRGVEHMVLSRFADGRHAHQRVLQGLFEVGFGFPHALSPNVSGISQFGHAVVDVEVDGLGRLAFANHHVPARHLEFSAKVAARVGAGNGARQGALGDDGVAPTRGGHGAGQWARRPNEFVVG